RSSRRARPARRATDGRPCSPRPPAFEHTALEHTGSWQLPIGRRPREQEPRGLLADLAREGDGAHLVVAALHQLIEPLAKPVERGEGGAGLARGLLSRAEHGLGAGLGVLERRARGALAEPPASCSAGLPAA